MCDVRCVMVDQCRVTCDVIPPGELLQGRELVRLRMKKAIGAARCCVLQLAKHVNVSRWCAEYGDVSAEDGRQQAAAAAAAD